MPHNRPTILDPAADAVYSLLVACGVAEDKDRPYFLRVMREGCRFHLLGDGWKFRVTDTEWLVECNYQADQEQIRHINAALARLRFVETNYDQVKIELAFTAMKLQPNNGESLPEAAMRLRDELSEARAEVERYRDLATQADHKNEQNTLRVDFLENGGMLLQTSNNFNEQEIADLFAKTYHCWVQVERCMFPGTPSDAEGR